MLRSFPSRSARAIRTCHAGACNLSSSATKPSSSLPNAPVDLDPSFRALLNDVDLSLLKHRARNTIPGSHSSPSRRELEVVPHEQDPEVDYLTSEELDVLQDREDREHRKSPAALFGSQRIGAISIPFELQQMINNLIAESDKPLLHADAERLFLDEGSETPEWSISFNKKYKSRRQAYLRGDRDGTAFASVALPAQYAVVYSVLDHIKHRMGPEWTVGHVIDWGSGTGSGLWASTHSFQKIKESNVSVTLDDATLAESTLQSYLGIDKRDGLVNIAKRLVKDLKTGDTTVTWKRSFSGTEKNPEDGEVLALSAFHLSTLPSHVARLTLFKEIWESNADTIVLIDHNTKAGFEAIAEAREYLLRKGKQQLADPSSSNVTLMGSHVLAPCPHDGACPLHQPGSKLICGFSQRLQRPDFVRKTKHSGIGHEDTGYSYVVIRRGERPPKPHTKVGRVGEVGRRVQEKLLHPQAPIVELLVDGEHGESASIESAPTLDSSSSPSVPSLLASSEEIAAALRAEAYSWPRLVFPPLKKSGHIILDGCTQEGKIMRMTIPRSQGKQPFYDARKSNWGDLFPHEPKNSPQERYAPTRGKRHDGTPLKGAHIGKSGGPAQKKTKEELLAFEKAKHERRKARSLDRREKHAFYGD